jgi:hypothetical protein
METVLGLTLAASPLLLMAGVLLLVERRRARRQVEVARQIALTDALHARLGALVAPLVTRRQRHWRISMALPADQPAVLAAVLRTVDEVFGRAPHELVVRRQTPPAARPAVHVLRAGQESLSWT